MAMSVTYTTIDGELLHENRGGVETYYLADPLGSVIECHDVNGNTISETWYWPYGEIQSETGTNPSPWAFVGTLGYYSKLGPTYVRARYYQPELTRWLTIDPIWPDESAYGYCYNAPISWTDEMGTAPKKGKCPKGYKLVKITCFGYNDPAHPNASNPVAYGTNKNCGGCERYPRKGDCASAYLNSHVCNPGEIVTILPHGPGSPIYCRICDTGNGHPGTIDIFVPVKDSHCEKHWNTGFYCIKCGY